MAEAVPRYHPLTSPEDFWQIVLGSGYRATVDALPVLARSRSGREFSISYV